MDTNHAPLQDRRATPRRRLCNVGVALLLSLFAVAPAVAGNSTKAVPQVENTPVDVDSLKPGEFVWMPERALPGQLVIVVSLPEQRAHVYRHGVRIGVSTVSTGKPSHPTPTGSFEILQKKETHFSNLYNNAPMPFMQRLTWDGIALHGGKIPGYPASHGCVRLPLAFAKKLYAETTRGMRVVIADETSHDLAVVYPGEQAPVDAYSGLALTQPAGRMSQGVASAP